MLDQATAAQFLLTRTGAGSGEEAASAELAGELGGLPLALEQAAAYMRATGRTITDYLGLFRDWRAELMARGDPVGYDKRVITTWELAFAELARSGPGVRTAAHGRVLRTGGHPAAAATAARARAGGDVWS